VATGRTLFDAYNAFNNTGTVDVQSGRVSISRELALDAGGTISGAGVLRLESGTATMIGTTTLAQGGSFELLGGTLTGTGDFAGTGAFRWNGGTVAGTNGIGPTAVMIITNGAVALAGSAVLNNAGTAIWDGLSNINADAGSRLNNSGLFEARNNAAFQYTSGNSPVPVFNNSGTFRKIGGTGETTFTFYSALNNSGILDLQNGSLVIQGPYTSTASSTVKVGLSGVIPATQFGRLVFSSSAALNGTLEAAVRSGLVLTNGSSFDVVTYPAHTSEFTASRFPVLAPGLSWRLTYSATALQLSVGQALTAGGLTKLSNGHFQMTWAGPPGTAAILQVSTNLIRWDSVVTNKPFTGTFFFDDGQAALFNSQFYRIMFVP
jgi:hypothetical protein